MQFERIEQLEEFTFDEQVIPLRKFNNLQTVIAFKDETLPIIVAQLKPLEVFLAAIMNEFAPLKDWGILESMIAAEKDIDKCLLPGFEIMLKQYLPERKYERAHIAAKISDIEYLYTIIMSQMKLERLLEYHLRRKLSLIMDLNEFAKLGVDITGWDTKAEKIIRDAVSRPIKQAI